MGPHTQLSVTQKTVYEIRIAFASGMKTRLARVVSTRKMNGDNQYFHGAQSPISIETMIGGGGVFFPPRISDTRPLGSPSLSVHASTTGSMAAPQPHSADDNDSRARHANHANYVPPRPTPVRAQRERCGGSGVWRWG
jgi:hypothetical protein